MDESLQWENIKTNLLWMHVLIWGWKELTKFPWTQKSKAGYLDEGNMRNLSQNGQTLLHQASFCAFILYGAQDLASRETEKSPNLLRVTQELDLSEDFLRLRDLTKGEQSPHIAHRK